MSKKNRKKHNALQERQRLQEIQANFDNAYNQNNHKSLYPLYLAGGAACGIARSLLNGYTSYKNIGLLCLTSALLCTGAYLKNCYDAAKTTQTIEQLGKILERNCSFYEPQKKEKIKLQVESAQKKTAGIISATSFVTGLVVGRLCVSGAPNLTPNQPLYWLGVLGALAVCCLNGVEQICHDPFDNLNSLKRFGHARV